MILPDTILSAAQAIADGHLAPLDLVDGALRRIDELDGDLQAWVMVDDDGARAQARALADELARGHCRGPLHGIPLGIKDIVDVAGWPTKAGSPLRARHRADSDATVVTRLRDAGAILLGKTVTTEFAGFDPPPTKNPWNIERTPGGSSSGSAAAVATGMCLGAVGSQTGGSITRPATYCGIAGCKPTFGRVSRAGVVPISVHLDHVGPMARTVADLAFMLQAMSGPDSRDPLASSEFAPDYAHALAEAGPPRLGLVEPFFLEQADPDVRQNVLDCVERLRAAGAKVDEALLPAGFEQVHARHRMLMAVEAYQYHREDYQTHRDRFGPNFSSLLEEGRQASQADYQAAVEHQKLFQQELQHWLAGFDALITPATTAAAPAADTTGDPRFNSPWSYGGVPTVSIPSGLSHGLPIGLQFIAAPWHEASLLRVAHWCESKLGWNERPRCT